MACHDVVKLVVVTPAAPIDTTDISRVRAMSPTACRTCKRCISFRFLAIGAVVNFRIIYNLCFKIWSPLFECLERELIIVETNITSLMQPEIVTI